MISEPKGAADSRTGQPISQAFRLRNPGGTVRGRPHDQTAAGGEAKISGSGTV